MRLPDMSGEQVCAALRTRRPTCAVVILTTYLSHATVSAALHAGAAEFVTKSAGLDELRAAIRRAAGGHSSDSTDRGHSGQVMRQLNGLLSTRSNEGMVSPQERTILELIAGGLTDDEIAVKMYISKSTVRYHLQKLKTRLNAKSKLDLATKAIRVGLIEFQQDQDDSSGPT